MKYNDVCCLMTNYNNAKYIRQAIESCIDMCQLLVVDDGSTDNSLDIIKEYGVNYISQLNRGPAHARNSGLQWITLEFPYTLLLDSDDWLKPNFLDETYSEIIKDQCVAVYGDYIVHKNETNVEYREYKMSLDNNKLWNECLMPHQALVDNSVWKKMMADYGMHYDNSLRVCNDYDVDLKINQYGYIKHVPKVLGYVREGTNNQCSNILGDVRNKCMNKLKQTNYKYYKE